MFPEEVTNPQAYIKLRQGACYVGKLRERRGKKREKPSWLHLGASLLRSLPHQDQTTSSPGFSFWVPGLEITLNRPISSPGCSGLCHYVVQGALRQPEPGVLRDGWELCPRWSWQPLWLEIAVQGKGSHLTVFAPCHFQRISALETSALSCLSSSSTFYLKHTWVLVLRNNKRKLTHCGAQFPPFPHLSATPNQAGLRT